MDKVKIVAYNTRWIDQFVVIANQLSDIGCFKEAVIYHIGSTSIPSLGAKDVIDVQAVVLRLEDFNVRDSDLSRLGYIHKPGLSDHVPVGVKDDKYQWKKYFFLKTNEGVRVNLHVRQKDNLNTRFALLFRDYLRNNTQMALSYLEAKKTIASYLSADNYPIVKDPVIDIIMVAAETWAVESNWKVPTNN